MRPLAAQETALAGHALGHCGACVVQLLLEIATKQARQGGQAETLWMKCVLCREQFLQTSISTL